MRVKPNQWAARWRRAKATKTLPLYFLHIPKTAGTSVATWLEQQLGQAAVCPARIWDQLVALDKQALPAYRAFCGHFGVDLEEFLGSKLLSACVFRDPVARTRSHYDHVVRDGGHPRHAYVARQSFAGFVMDENNWPMIENFQARYLVNTPLHFFTFRDRLDRDGSKQSRLSVLSEDARYLLDRGYVRAKSLETLDGLDVVGVTENLLPFLSALTTRAKLGDTGGQIVAPRENVTVRNNDDIDLDANVQDIIRRLTGLDQEIYELACLRALPPSTH